MTRLKDEPVFLALAQKVSDYLLRVGDLKNLPKVGFRQGRTGGRAGGDAEDGH